RAGVAGVLGAHETTNVHGEQQQKLDVYANDALLYCLSARSSIGNLASEENEEPIILHHGSPEAKYAVVFDPLDGSSNIDVNVSVGTIFAILRRPEAAAGNIHNWVLQPGSELDRKSTRLNSSHDQISYAVFCLKKKNHP